MKHLGAQQKERRRNGSISGEEGKWGHKTVNLWRAEGRLGPSRGTSDQPLKIIDSKGLRSWTHDCFRAKGAWPA